MPVGLARGIPEVQHVRMELNWQLGHSDAPDARPDKMVPATVPGNVQLDWAAATGMPDPYYGENFRQYEWMERAWWHYEATLPEFATVSGRQLVLSCGGVDYAYEVKLDGAVLHQHEGMFAPFRLEIPATAKPGSVLQILIQPAPNSGDRTGNHTEANRCAKPAVAYGWDWHPRLIPLGIYTPLTLEWRPLDDITEVNWNASLSDDFSVADISLEVSLAATLQAGMVEWELRDPEGREVLRQSKTERVDRFRFRAMLPSPQLWWTHDMGEPTCYQLIVRLCDAEERVLAERTKHVGFRRVRLVMQEAWWEPVEGLPKSRGYPPIQVELNARRLFAKGTNWVPPDIFPARITRDTYEPLVQMAKEAHFNLLRSWGGGMISHESFFDLCDEMGLLVWQEFPLACNCYPDDPHYLQVLEAEARAIVQRVRQHPCLALWSGGNELFNSWSGMTDQSLALRMLNRVCLELDPATPFIPTAPLMGMGHGDYRFRNEKGVELFCIYPERAFTAYSEFGCPGPSSVEVLHCIIPPEELFPPKPGGSWQAHHAFDSWDIDPHSWLMLSTLEDYFGPAEDLEALVAQGQWLQAEGYRFIYEEARRQAPFCVMALNWCYNEPWPSAANNSLITWPARPKPAYAAVQSACRPTLASARVPKFTWKAGEMMRVQLFMLHDAPQPLAGGQIEVGLQRAGGPILPMDFWSFPNLPTATNAKGPVVEIGIPGAPPPPPKLSPCISK